MDVVAASTTERLLAPFRRLFTRPTFARLSGLATGALLASGPRTVTAGLRAVGKGDDAGFASFHRVLNAARWSALAAARVLLLLLVAAFVPQGPVVIGIDDTIERRKGARIAAKGIYRDPVRSSKGCFVKVSGLRWLSLMVLARVPFARAVWGLPFLTVLCPSERAAEKAGKQRHKKLTDWARQALLQATRWLPGRTIVVVADSGYAVIELCLALVARAVMISRLRLDARLFEPAPPRRPGQIGRPRRVGGELPKLAAVAEGTRARGGPPSSSRRARTAASTAARRPRAPRSGIIPAPILSPFAGFSSAASTATARPRRSSRPTPPWRPAGGCCGCSRSAGRWR